MRNASLPDWCLVIFCPLWNMHIYSCLAYKLSIVQLVCLFLCTHVFVVFISTFVPSAWKIDFCLSQFNTCVCAVKVRSHQSVMWWKLSEYLSWNKATEQLSVSIIHVGNMTFLCKFSALTLYYNDGRQICGRVHQYEPLHSSHKGNVDYFIVVLLEISHRDKAFHILVCQAFSFLLWSALSNNIIRKKLVKYNC